MLTKHKNALPCIPLTIEPILHMCINSQTKKFKKMTNTKIHQTKWNTVGEAW